MKKPGMYSGDDLQRLGRPNMREVEEMVADIKRCLRGAPPLVQSAALADVVSMLFAGHNPVVREQAMEAWLSAMRGLIKVNEAALLERYGMSGWDEKTN